MFFMSTPPPPPTSEVIVEATIPQPDDPILIDNESCARNGQVSYDFTRGFAPSDEYVQGTTHYSVMYCYFLPEQATTNQPTVSQQETLPQTGNNHPFMIAMASLLIFVGGFLTVFKGERCQNI